MKKFVNSKKVIALSIAFCTFGMMVASWMAII